MVVYRICKSKYAQELSSSGSSNRWNVNGQYVIYSSQHISLATLELLVHSSFIKPTVKYTLLHIDFPEESMEEIKLDDLPKNWRSLQAYGLLQRIGSAWYRKQESLILKVPSAVIPQEFNYLINYQHPLIKHVNIVKRADYYWDTRFAD